MPKVSIIVPIYNAAAKLDKCIKSILGQSFQDLELILVNDGSTDDSLAICMKYAAQDYRVAVVNQKNAGCIAARRAGVEKSTSPHLMYVDADDWAAPDMVKILYENALACDADITVCNSYKFVGDLVPLKRPGSDFYFQGDRLYQGKAIKDILVVAYLHGHPFPANLFGKLYKRDLLESCGRYLNRLTFMGEDYYYNIEMLLAASRVKVVNQPLYYYRAGGGTSKYMPYLYHDVLNGYRIQKEIIAQFFQDDEREGMRRGIDVMLLNYFKTCLGNLFSSGLDEIFIQLKIKSFAGAVELQEAAEARSRYFDQRYLDAIKNLDVDYLYLLGHAEHKKGRLRRYAMQLLAKII